MGAFAPLPLGSLGSQIPMVFSPSGPHRTPELVLGSTLEISCEPPRSLKKPTPDRTVVRPTPARIFSNKAPIRL